MSRWDSIKAFFGRENAKDTSLPLYTQGPDIKRGFGRKLYNTDHEAKTAKEGRNPLGRLPSNQWTTTPDSYETQDRGHLGREGGQHGTIRWWRPKYEEREIRSGPDGGDWPHEDWPGGGPSGGGVWGSGGERIPWPGEEDDPRTH
jgi:hypothetical protein